MMDENTPVTYLTRFYNWVADEQQWMPAHMEGWDDLVPPHSGIYYPRMQDLLIPTILLGILLLGVRYLFQRFVAIPIALYLGIKHKKEIKLEKNPILEEVYLKCPKPSDTIVEDVCKKTSLSQRQVQRWFRKRNKADAPGEMKKFCECSWQFLFYLCSFWYGVYVLWDKPWLWDLKEIWNNHPFHHVPDSIFYYYFVEAAFYWNMVYSIVYDHKRKDFKGMVIHHIATLLLINLSWLSNYVRVGTLILMLHDASDYWMLLAKMTIHSKRDSMTTPLFLCFVIVWIVSRLIYYPRIVYSCIFDNIESSDRILYYLIMGSLVVLQILHIVWTIMIAKIIIGVADNGKVKDVRSDSEDDVALVDEKVDGNNSGREKAMSNGTTDTTHVETFLDRNSHLNQRA